jgi:hypothetical protein
MGVFCGFKNAASSRALRPATSIAVHAGPTPVASLEPACNQLRPSPRIVICCEFAALHQEAVKRKSAQSHAAVDVGTAGAEHPAACCSSETPDVKQKEQDRPRHGDRVIHKELRSLVKQIELSMSVNR